MRPSQHLRPRRRRKSVTLPYYADGMAGCPGFGVLLARLAGRRGLDAAGLSRLSGVGESEVRAVFDGVVPDPSLLRRLAPALGLHAADLFVIAGAPVPDELAPLDAEAKPWVRGLVNDALPLSPEQRRRLRQRARSLPQQSRTQPVPPPRSYEQYEPSPGAMITRMLHIRNLHWLGAATALACVTNGQVYLSAATIGTVGRGGKELTPDLMVAYASVLGVPVGDLAALAGVELPDVAPNPVAAEMAELIWDVRRLTADQVQQVSAEAKSMQQGWAGNEGGPDNDDGMAGAS